MSNTNNKVRKVLIVDDEPAIGDILKRVLTALHVPCDIAYNGQEALNQLQAEHYDAVLCDIMMPQMDGLSCLAQAQAHGILTPFVFVTGYGDENKILQAVRLGAVDFIFKPFDNADIADVAMRVLDMGARQHRIHEQIQNQDENLFKRVRQDEKMISLLRASNNKKRAG